MKAYAAEELGGLIFVYMGPSPAPLLPRWDILVWNNVTRDVDAVMLPCNWLQCMDNSLDPVHFQWLHQGRLRPCSPISPFALRKAWSLARVA